jgi:hypothetical protein
MLQEAASKEKGGKREEELEVVFLKGSRIEERDK